MKKCSLILSFLSAVTLLVPLCIPALADGASEDSPLKGLDVLFVGDSICEARVEWEDPNYGKEFCGWAGRIAKSDGINSTNLSNSGASVSDCRGANTVIAQLQKASGQHFDLVVLHGGVNDAWDAAPVGEMIDGFEITSFDQTTFGGGLERTFAYAKKAFPDAKFAFIINFALPAAEAGKRLTDMSEYFDLAKKICDKWEIPYLDLYNNIEVNNRLEVATSKTYLRDHIHPSTKGYDVLSPYIAKFLRSLFPVPEPPESSEEPAPESEPAPVSSEASEQEPEKDPFPVVPVVIGAAAVLAVGAAACILIKKKKQK